MLMVIMAFNFPFSNTSGASSGSHDSFASTYGSAGNEAGLEVSDHDFFYLNEWFENEIPTYSSFSPDYNPYANYSTTVDDQVLYDQRKINSISLRDGDLIKRNNGSITDTREIRDKVAFKTKSEIEVLDDGFKWRKYGKKMVKNNQYPRNYYKCSVEGCPVKKRVERDNEDRRYVLTTYEGIHNHECPTN